MKYARQAWRARWQALSPREQSSLRLALTVVTAALAWLILLAPAIDTMARSPARLQALQQQLQQMRQQQAVAQALQKQPRVSAHNQARALELSLAPLGGAARIERRAQQAVVTLQQLPPAALAAWLLQLRQQLHMQPVEVRLQRDAPTSSWSGTLSFALATDAN